MKFHTYYFIHKVNNMILKQCWIFKSYHDEYIMHGDVIKWKHFPRYWPFVRGIHPSPVNFLTKRPVKQSSDVFFGLCTYVHNWDPGVLRHHRATYDVTLMMPFRKDPRVYGTKHRWNFLSPLMKIKYHGNSYRELGNTVKHAYDWVTSLLIMKDFLTDSFSLVLSLHVWIFFLT